MGVDAGARPRGPVLGHTGGGVGVESQGDRIVGSDRSGVDFPVTDRSGLPVPMPVRTCVGCRRRDSWSALLRVVAVRGETDSTMNGAVVLVPDPRHRLPGRGAWLHPSTTCFEQAVRRKAFTRALRLQAGPDVSRVADHLEAAQQDASPHPTDHDRPTEGGSDADEHSMSTQQ